MLLVSSCIFKLSSYISFWFCLNFVIVLYQFHSQHEQIRGIHAYIYIYILTIIDIASKLLRSTLMIKLLSFIFLIILYDKEQKRLITTRKKVYNLSMYLDPLSRSFDSTLIQRNIFDKVKYLPQFFFFNYQKISY